MIEQKANYGEYYNRLTSYENWKSDVYVKALVEAGFVYSGENDTVFCFKCGITLNRWQEEDDPIIRHELANRDCYFLLDRSRNIPGITPTVSQQKSFSDYEKDSIMFDWVPGKGAVRVDEGNNVGEYNTMEPSHRSEPVSDPTIKKLSNEKMKEERFRFQSFALCTPHKHWPDPDVLSSAGFYYDADKEIMKCFCCGATVVGWESSEQDVIQKHKSMSPDCDHVKGMKPLQNVGKYDNYNEERMLFDSLSISDKHGTHPNKNSDSSLQNNVHSVLPSCAQPYSEQHSSEHSMSRENSRSPSFSFHQRPEPVPHHPAIQYHHPLQAPPSQHMYERHSRPQLPVDSQMERRQYQHGNRTGTINYTTPQSIRRDSNGMSDVTKRLETFFTWPKTAYMQPFELAQAGFVYTGSGDAVKCYKCGVSLKNWEPKDNAWSEHEKFSPVCPLVIERVRKVHFANQVRSNNASSYDPQHLVRHVSHPQQSLPPQQQQQCRSPVHNSHSMRHDTNLSLNENFLRFHQQQYQQIPSYESSRSLPTGSEEKYRMQRNIYADNYRSSVTETPPGPHSFSIPNKQTITSSLSYSGVPNGYSNGIVYPIQNSSIISNNYKKSTSGNQPINHDLNHSYNITNGTYEYTEPKESSYSFSRELSKEYAIPKLSSHNYASESSNVYSISRESPRNYSPSKSLFKSQNNLSMSLTSPTKRSIVNTNSEENIKKLEEMGFSRDIIQKTLDCYNQYSSHSFSSLDDFAQAVICYQENGTLEGTPFGKNLNVDPTKAGEDMIYDRVNNKKIISLRKPLESDRQGCKICMDNDVEVTFVPCGHLIVCESCALGQKLCPLCRKEIKETVRTYYFGN